MDKLFPSVVAEEFDLITLNCADGVKLRAFKNIIAAKSDVLSAMFSTDMQEKQQNEVNIVDFNSDVMTEFLRFLYIEKVQLLDKIDIVLYKVAEKYLVEDLKSVCVDSMKERLKIENIVEILKFANLHDENLYEHCLIRMYK